MDQHRCEHTGLTRPECSCAPCVRLLMHEYAPEAIRAGVEMPVIDPEPFIELVKDRELPTVAERLARPVI